MASSDNDNYCNECVRKCDGLNATCHPRTDSNVETLTKIVNDLIHIVNELKEKIDKMNQIETSCKNMDRHIQFVEESYENLCKSRPFTIASKVTNFLKGGKPNTIEN
uniref:Uncharacterized protein n=1 Tax=viral metagenome TaxID=1070528 RepID=A0A6C0KRV9_9ZZZZ